MIGNTGRKTIYKRQRLEAKIKQREDWIDEASALLSRILTGEQVQMYTIGGRSLQHYQLSPSSLKAMIDEWENELMELQNQLDGGKSRRAFVAISSE